jgi:poly(hydroxyalkanoate) depolymerase family esterase
MRTPVDWRELYAQNRAAIARSGVPSAMLDVPALPDVPAPPTRRFEPNRARTSKRALVYAPPGAGVDGPAPLVCMLHGCTQDPESFATATRVKAAAERHGFVAVLPAQDRSANAMGCWNWFEPAHRRRGAGEPAAIAGVVGDLVGASDIRVDPRRVFVCGLSSGGAMAAVLAATYPDVFAAAAIHSGLAFGSASDTSSAFAAMKRGGADPAAHGRAAHAAMGERARAIPTMVIHGTADSTVSPVNAHQALGQAMATNRLAAPDCAALREDAPATVDRGRVENGHPYTRARWTDGRGAPMHELLLVDGLGHAWSGGAAGGSYTDPRGPDATEAIIRFFAEVAAHDRLALTAGGESAR